jgi:IS30 family transposase
MDLARQAPERPDDQRTLNMIGDDANGGNYNDARGILNGRVGIDQRLNIVEERTCLGDPKAFIKTVEHHINNRPIRKFDYLLPI